MSTPSVIFRNRFIQAAMFCLFCLFLFMTQVMADLLIDEIRWQLAAVTFDWWEGATTLYVFILMVWGLVFCSGYFYYAFRTQKTHRIE